MPLFPVEKSFAVCYNQVRKRAACRRRVTSAGWKYARGTKKRMGFLKELFRKQTAQEKGTRAASVQETGVQQENAGTDVKNEQCLRLLVLGQEMEKLFQAESYVAKSEYRDRMKEFKSTEDFFRSLQAVECWSLSAKRMDLIRNRQKEFWTAMPAWKL